MTITVDIRPEVQVELARQAAVTAAQLSRMPQVCSEERPIFRLARTI